MNCLQRFFRRFGRGKIEEDTVSAGQRGTLDRLPLEITQQIARFLPLHSAAALALCSHSLLQILGDRYWRRLRESCNKEEKTMLLQLLDRDLPDHLFCESCAKLHLPNNGYGSMQDMLYRVLDRRCQNADWRDYRAFDCCPLRFHFTDVQSATKRYRLGRDWETDLQGPSFSEPGHRRGLFLFLPRTVAGEMFARGQHWIPMATAAGQIPTLPLENHISICAHLMTYPNALLLLVRNAVFDRMLECKIKHYNNDNEAPCASCAGLKQCPFCPTEYQIDIKSYDDRRTAVVVTKWLALGAGLSCRDSKGRSHLIGKNDKPQPYSFEPNSIQSAFESGSRFDFASPLDDQHRELLFSLRPCREDQGPWKSDDERLSQRARYVNLKGF